MNESGKKGRSQHGEVKRTDYRWLIKDSRQKCRGNRKQNLISAFNWKDWTKSKVCRPRVRLQAHQQSRRARNQADERTAPRSVTLGIIKHALQLGWGLSSPIEGNDACMLLRNWLTTRGVRLPPLLADSSPTKVIKTCGTPVCPVRRGFSALVKVLTVLHWLTDLRKGLVKYMQPFIWNTRHLSTYREMNNWLRNRTSALFLST